MVSPIFPIEYWKLAGAVECLHAEVHSIDDKEVRAAQTQLSRQVEFAIAVAGFSDRLKDVALHVEHENLVAQSIRYINALLRRVYGNSRGPLEISFAAFQAADSADIFSAWFKYKDLARIRIGYVDVVLCVDRDALRRRHRILAFFPALDELVLALRKIEDMNTAMRPGSVTMRRPRESLVML